MKNKRNSFLHGYQEHFSIVSTIILITIERRILEQMLEDGYTIVKTDEGSLINK